MPPNGNQIKFAYGKRFPVREPFFCVIFGVWGRRGEAHYTFRERFQIKSGMAGKWGVRDDVHGLKLCERDGKIKAQKKTVSEPHRLFLWGKYYGQVDN